MKKHLLPLLLTFCTNTPSVNFYNMVVEQFLIEEAVEQELYTALLEQVIDPAKKIFEARRLHFQESARMGIANLYDLGMVEDSEFWSYFHMTRKTIKMVVRDATDHYERKKVQNNRYKFNTVPLETSIALSIWYLRNDTSNVEDALKLFNLNSMKEVETGIENGLQLISNLKAQSGLVWPTMDEMEYSAMCISQRYKFENSIGAMTHKLFTTIKGQRMTLLAVFNEKFMFKYAEISYNTIIRVALRTVPRLMNTLDDLPERFSILGDGSFNTCTNWKNINKVITPIEETDFGGEEKEGIKIFNEMQEAAMTMATGSLNETIERFPRILKLHKILPEAIIAACVLHNYCIKYRDEAPFF